jgi:hypothetical protein
MREFTRAFGCAVNERPGCGFPVAKVVALFHAGTGLFRYLLPGPLRPHEMASATRLRPQTRADVVLVGHRALGSFDHLALPAQQGLHGAVGRCPAPVGAGPWPDRPSVRSARPVRAAQVSHAGGERGATGNRKTTHLKTTVFGMAAFIFSTPSGLILVSRIVMCSRWPNFTRSSRLASVTSFVPRSPSCFRFVIF